MATLEGLFGGVSRIFDQVQVSAANHRKNSVALHKLHRSAVETAEQQVDGSLRLTGERRFNSVFVDLVARILVVKKGVLPADRAVKFVGAYVAYITEKGLPAPVAASSLSDDEDSDTPASRFIAHILKFLLKGFEARDKNIRFRCVGTVAELIAHLGELDEDVYEDLRRALLNRRRDKEAAIRAQAVLALTKLMGSDSDDTNADEASILEHILESLCSDSASEVRRLALVNVPILPETLPIILTRTRDVDASVCALVYSKVLCRFHPAQLTIGQREMLVRDGLGDREEKVKAAAADMIDVWFGIASGNDGADFLTDVMRFLGLFDLTCEEGIAIATDALRSIFVTRVSAVRKVVFSGVYWQRLTPESSVFARCFIEHTSPDSADASCSGIGLSNGQMTENAGIPVVTAFAFFLQETCNCMLDSIEELENLKTKESNEVDPKSDGEEEFSAAEQCEETLLQKVCVLGEMLKAAACLDYTDEVGRRKMFLVIRSMIGVEYLPESLIDSCLEVLKITTNDREMVKITVEVMVELRDSLFDDEEQDSDTDGYAETLEGHTTHATMLTGNLRRSNTQPARELTVHEKLRAEEIDLRCLALCIAMLKRVNGNFSENSVLEGVVNDLIVPSIKRSEVIHRELGLTALGLCCLIAKDMALQSFPLFCGQVQNVPEHLKAKILQILLDLLLMHSNVFFQRSQETTDQIISFLLQTFEHEDSSAPVRAVICIGLSKLMLNGAIMDERVLAALVLAFLSPANSDNQELRQCLSYFIPAYCYSSFVNQTRMQSIFFTVYDLVAQVYEELDENQSMVTPIQFCALFVDWTDPQKRASGSTVKAGSEDIHLNLAIDILTACHQNNCSLDAKCAGLMLPKLHLPAMPDPCNLLCLKMLLDNLNEHSFKDSAMRKAADKFKARVFKQLSKQFRNLNAREHENDAKYRKLCDILQATAPSPESSDADDDSEDGTPSRGRALSPMKPSMRRKARSTSSDASDSTQSGISVQNVPPLSRTPSASPISLPLPASSTSISVIKSRSNSNTLPFKTMKIRATGLRYDNKGKRRRAASLGSHTPDGAGSSDLNEDDASSSQSSKHNQDVATSRHRPRRPPRGVILPEADSQDSDT